MAFGTTLSEAQGALDRQRALDATQLFQALAQTGQFRRDDAARAAALQEAEAERAVRYFGLGQQKELSLKQLESQAAQLDKQIEAEAKRLKSEIDSRKDLAKTQAAAQLEVAGLNSETQKTVAEINSRRPDPKVAEAQELAEFEAEQLNALADAAARRANAALARIRALHADRLKASYSKIFTGTDRVAYQNAEKAKADQEFLIKAADLQASLGEAGQFVYFDEKANQFRPVKIQGRPATAKRNIIPGSLPSTRKRFNPQTGQFELVQ